jgi:hypothetical protein
VQTIAQRGYTEAEVLAALRGRYGTRFIDSRYSLLDADNVYLRELDNVIAASISQNTLSEIKRTARFTLHGDGGINFLSNRIQPWCRLYMPGLAATEPRTYDGVLQAAIGRTGPAEPVLRYKLDEATPDYQHAVAALNPLVWYKLDEPVESPNAVNSGANGPVANGAISHPSTMPGAAGLANGTNGAFAFVTANDNRVTAIDGSLTGKTSLTIAAWVQATALGNGSIVCLATAASGGSIRVELMHIATGGVSAAVNCIRAAVRVGASTVASETLAGTQIIGAPVHLAMTWTTGEAPKIYVNGALATVTSNAPLSGSVTAYTHTILGNRGGSLGWGGSIDGPFITDTALTAQQILELYRSGVDQALALNSGSAGHSYDGVPTGAGMPGAYSLVTGAEAGGSSYELDPLRDNRLRLPGAGALFDNADRITASFWFRVNELNANDFFIDNTNTGGQTDGFSVWKHTSNLLVWRMKLSTGIFWAVGQADSISKQTTYHCVVTWQTGKPARMWLNGVEQVLVAQSGSQPLAAVGLIDMPNQDLYLGKWMFDNTVGAATLLNGMLDDVTITPSYVDENDVARMYRSGIQSGKYGGKGENYVEWPQGVFLLTSPTRDADAYDTITRQVDAYDQLQVYVDDQVTERFTATAGDRYTDVISGLLGNIDKSITPSLLELPVSRDWEPATPKLTIINDLCQAINYESLFFDEYGEAVVRPYVSPADRSPEFVYRDDADSVTVPQVNQMLDLFGVPNKWVVVVSEPDRLPLRSEYTNDDPGSPTSTLARGRTITDYRVDAEAPDQTTLDDKARRLALEASQVFEVVTFDTLIMPFHSHNDVITFAYGTLVIDDKYAEQGWDLDLTAGTTMRHTIRKVVTLA